MNEPGVTFTPSSAAKTSVPEPGMQRNVLAYDPRLMLVRNFMNAGWKGARHSHPHHQIVYVVRGRICFEAEGSSWDMCAGDSVVVDGNVEHQASAFEDSEVLDIFTPYREDYA
jgi:quercetin dioxygenase-like cupin family protein